MQPPTMKTMTTSFILLLALTLLSFALLGTTSRMMMDDYCTAVEGQERGAVGSMVWHYQNWSGRYGHFFVNGWAGGQTPRVAPALTTGLVIALTLLLMTLFWRVFQGQRERVWLSAVFGLMGAYVAFDGIPSWQSWYWFSGNVAYILPQVVTVLCLHLGLTAWRADQNGHPAWWLVPLGSGLALFAAGLSEIYALMQVMVFSVVTLALWRLGQRRGSFWLSFGAAIMAVMGLLLILNAPGNDVRQGVLVDRWAGLAVQVMDLSLGEVLIRTMVVVALFISETRLLPMALAVWLLAALARYRLTTPAARQTEVERPRRVTLSPMLPRVMLVWQLLVLALLMVVASGTLAPVIALNAIAWGLFWFVMGRYRREVNRTWLLARQDGVFVLLWWLSGLALLVVLILPLPALLSGLNLVNALALFAALTLQLWLMRPAPPSFFTRGGLMALALLALLMLVAVTLGTVYASGEPPPARAVAMPFFFVYLVMLAWGWLTGALLQQWWPPASLRPSHRRVMVALGWLIAILPLQSLLLNVDRWPRYQLYAQSWDERHEVLLAAEEGTTMSVPPFAYSVPAELNLDTVAAFDWVEACASAYYGLAEIRVRAP